MTTKRTEDLIIEWRNRGPVAWAEGAYGWVGIEGKPIRLSPWQRAVLSAWWDHREEVTTLGISNIKKTGKTFIDGVLLAWRWLALPGVHFACANDLDQSTGRQFAEIVEMVKRNSYLRENVKIAKRELVFTPTGSVLQALAGDATGNAGANHLTISHTEAWGIVYEQDIRNFEELTPPPGQFYGLPCLRIADSYAGYLEESNTWHDLIDRGLSGDRLPGDWPIYRDGGLLLFHMQGNEAKKRCFRGTALEADSYYIDQRATLRENAYKRLHENVRTVNIGNFIDQDDWEVLIDENHHPLPRGNRTPVYIGLDLAIAAGGDDCALIGVYFEGKVKIAFHKVWKGGRFRLRKLKLADTVEPYILKLAEDYKLQAVYFDPWQAVHLAEHLQEAGIRCVEVKQTHSTRGPKDTALYELASNQQLVLYDHDDLRYMTGGAMAKELPNNMIYLTKAGGRQKIDLLIALSNCADVCHEEGMGYRGVNVLPNLFYDWEGAELDDFADIDGRMEYLPTRNRHKHPEGITWRTCKHRNKGCEACIDEMKIEGVYERDRQEVLHIEEPTNEETARQDFYSRLGYHPMNQRSSEDDHKIRETFRRAARRRLA